MRGFSGLALAADTGASVGGVSAAVVCLVLYFILLKDRLNLQNVTKLIVITSVSGLVSAMLIGPASAMATIMVLVIMSPFVAYPVAQQESGESAA